MHLRTLLLSAALVGCAKTPTTPEPEPMAPSAPMPPETRRELATSTLQGTEVTEHYRWLEGTGDDVTTWAKAQNAHARAHLDGLAQREALEAELEAILQEDRVSVWDITVAGGTTFAVRQVPPEQHGSLVVLTSLDDPTEARRIVDPDALDPDKLTGIDFFAPSPDGTRVAVSLSRAGTESGDLHLFDATTGEPTGLVIPRVNGGTAGGAVAWAHDSSGFWYTRYPREGERPPEDLDFYQEVWWHPLDGGDDVPVLHEGLPRIAELDVRVHPRTGDLLITMQDGDGGEFAHWLKRRGSDTLESISVLGDRTVQATFTEDGKGLWLLSRAEAPRGKLLTAPLSDTTARRVVIPEGDDTLVDSFWGHPTVLHHGGVVVTTWQLGGPSTLRVFDPSGKAVDGPELPAVADVDGLTPLPEGRILFKVSTYTAPSQTFVFDPSTGETTEVVLSEPSKVDLSGVEVVREMAPSKDGTQVPVNVLVPAGVARDGSAPCVVTGYGGYGVSLTPRFRASDKPLLDRGVVVAIANLRGGGEYGEEWHRQGMLTTKQNVFDDFHGVIAHLKARGFCDPERVGIAGGSNGGLLMGATFTQHPADVAAVVSDVGIYDMLRVELSPNGAFNVTEFGTVEDPDQFAALYAYSPYHHVDDAITYPPVLLTHGANDPRVSPWQSYKMTARMQHAGAPIWLRVGFDAGHGAANVDGRIAQITDRYAFFLHHLGVGDPSGS